MSQPTSPYEWIGGEDTIKKLVDVFYTHVTAHPDLSPLFPEDIEPVKEKQFQFLSQYFGGPSLYTDQHGHPMMRARHMRFPITPERADAWLHCMERAITDIGLMPEQREWMIDRLRGTAYHFVNS